MAMRIRGGAGDGEGAPALVRKTFYWVQDRDTVVKALLIGSWTTWKTFHAMSLEGGGGGGHGQMWKVDVALPAGWHAFKFVVDGDWIKSSEYDAAPDGMGTDGNNVIQITAEEPPAVLMADDRAGPGLNGSLAGYYRSLGIHY
jgi:hypothetical protein